MAQNNNQTYQVQYTIRVDATEGTRQVQAFADSIGNLTRLKLDIPRAVSNIKGMMDQIDKAFRTKNGKRRDYSFKMSIDTHKTEEKLGRVKSLLTEIRELSKGIQLAINTSKPINTRAIKAQATRAVDPNTVSGKYTPNIQSIRDTQKDITKIVGKVNSALISLQAGREINIKTDIAKQRLTEILALMGQIRIAGAGMHLGGITSSRQSRVGSLLSIPNSTNTPYALPRNIQNRIQEKIQLRRLRDIQHRDQQQEQRRVRENEKQEKNNAARILHQSQRQTGFENSMYASQRRGAINRLQYSKAPSLRNLPFGYMFNAYMAYGMIKRELSEAVDYANIMESAHSILKVADTDLSTFNTRFDQMARNVRQIGVETKFTAIEIGGAVKFLSMAGMNIDSINKSIRPITNLALIGDNDVAQIADLTTNIMAGYDIKSSSMDSVADIIASTISRSNVNIVEMAESYKMASGYLNLAGVDFSESAAAIGILGNMGIKGTMAGTSLRAMSTRFAKPTREAQKVLDKLDVKFTHNVDIYGKQVEKLRPLADIFEELDNKGASLEDMIAIFSKIGGTAGMMFLKNHDKIRELTSQNRVSHGISGELADVKKNTTKGLWAQVTSQFSEAFMQGFEIMEPQIRSVLRDFLSKFSAREFAQGLASVGRVLLDIFSTFANIATLFVRNFSWIEPLLFTGLVATRLFKLAGALTNVGIALGFIGKQSLAGSAMQSVSSMVGLAGFSGGAMSMANKRALVNALNAAGISGKGNLTQALLSGGTSTVLARNTTGILSTQVATGGGLMGAGASISAMGASAVIATAGISALVGVLGYLAYKTWKVKEAKDAVLEELDSNKKYIYPSINALTESLRETYNQAIRTKTAIDDLTTGKTIEESSGQSTGMFTSNGWTAWMSMVGSGIIKNMSNSYNYADAYQDDVKSAIQMIAKREGQNHINASWAAFGKLKSALEVDAYINTIDKKFKQDESSLDTSLWTVAANGKIIYKKDMGKMGEKTAMKTRDFMDYQNGTTVPVIRKNAEIFRDIIKDSSSSQKFLEDSGLDFNLFNKAGYQKNKAGIWVDKPLNSSASDEQRKNKMTAQMNLQEDLIKHVANLRGKLGGSSEAAETIMKKAGISPHLYSNEPGHNDLQPYNANRITNLDDDSSGDDRSAGGNYSGTGKLSSTAPKQVIVNISSLLSVQTIDLMKSKEGQVTEVQNLKEQLAQALIDVVHDFDASWNG